MEGPTVEPHARSRRGNAVKIRQSLATTLVLSVFWSADAAALGPPLGDGGFVRFGLGPAVAQDFGGPDAVPMPGFALLLGLGGWVTDQIALEVGGDASIAWSLTERTGEPASESITAGVKARYLLDRRRPDYVVAGLGVAGRLDGGVSGGGAYAGYGLQMSTGVGFVLAYTPRVVEIDTAPTFVHAIVACGTLTLDF